MCTINDRKILRSNYLTELVKFMKSARDLTDLQIKITKVDMTNCYDEIFTESDTTLDKWADKVTDYARQQMYEITGEDTVEQAEELEAEAEKFLAIARASFFEPEKDPFIKSLRELHSTLQVIAKF
jgi:hypothetical protein